MVSGTVLDATGEPIIGASVVEKGTTNGTVTDMDGKFTLTVSSAKAELEVSYIGYKTQTLKSQAGKPLSVTMSEDTEMLDEVIVVGYGTMKKKRLNRCCCICEDGRCSCGYGIYYQSRFGR